MLLLIGFVLLLNIRVNGFCFQVSELQQKIDAGGEKMKAQKSRVSKIQSVRTCII